jgi:hypothetical protein
LALLFLLPACGGGIPLDEDAVFQPRKSLTPSTFDYDNADLDEVFFEADDGTRLNAWHIDREDSRATVLYFGGQGFNLVLAREFVTHMLADVPVDLFMVDYRGYGRSEGEPEVAQLKSDGLRAYDVLTERHGVEPAEIFIHGHSMGSFVASFVAQEREVAGLVMEAAATDVDGWTDALVPWYLRLFLSFDVSESLAGESNLERVRRIDVPSLFLVGSKDVITPPELTRELHEASGAATKQLVVVDGGEHNGLEAKPAFRRAYTEFIEAHAPD